MKEDQNQFREDSDDLYFQEAAFFDADDFIEEDNVTRKAVETFGIKYLFPWQRIVIQNILDAAQIDIPQNESKVQYPADSSDEEKIEEENAELLNKGRQIVLLPTGAGKSLCFLTPALLLPGPTLVLYPLLALMSDQKRRMDEGHMKSVVFRGGQSDEEREENFRQIKDGARIILANPEVLQNKSLLKKLAACNISHIAIDEAHCVWEWGSTFRPAYLTLGDIIKELKVPLVTAFTATASPLVLEKVSSVLFDGKAHIVRSDGDRPNIHYKVINAYAKKRAAFRLAVTQEKPLIIFCGTRKKSEDMARELAEYYGRDKVKFYHAGMEKEEKAFVEKWFYPKEDAILCCTCAFGMGVDKKNIRTVIHLEASPTAEAYIQEAGRGGRDGGIANAILLWSPQDHKKYNQFAPDSRERVLMTFAESTTCRREVLLNALGDQLTFCDGCDICQTGAAAESARDADSVIKFMKKNKKIYTREGLEKILLQKFNSWDLSRYKKNIWDDKDIKEIICQLEEEGKILPCKWPWRKLYTVKKSKRKLPPITIPEAYKSVPDIR